MRVEVASLQAEMAGLRAMESQVARSLSAMKINKVCRLVIGDVDKLETSRVWRNDHWKGVSCDRLHFCHLLYSPCPNGMLSIRTPAYKQALPSVFFAPKAPDQDTTQPHQKGNTNGDWISFLLALSISHLPTGTLDIDVGVWSRGISLLLTGVLILSSLTQVLRSLTRVLKLTSKTVGAGFLLLSLGQLFVRSLLVLIVECADRPSRHMSFRFWYNSVHPCPQPALT